MFGSLLKAVVGTVLVPVDVVRDVTDMDVITGDRPSKTAKRLEDIGSNLDKATDPDDG